MLAYLIFYGMSNTTTIIPFLGENEQTNTTTPKETKHHTIPPFPPLEAIAATTSTSGDVWRVPKAKAVSRSLNLRQEGALPETQTRDKGVPTPPPNTIPPVGAT